MVNNVGCLKFQGYEQVYDVYKDGSFYSYLMTKKN